jgi:adenosine deaminase
MEKDFRRVTLAAVDAAFCDEETRERVRARVEAGYE